MRHIVNLDLATCRPVSQLTGNEYGKFLYTELERFLSVVDTFLCYKQPDGMCGKAEEQLSSKRIAGPMTVISPRPYYTVLLQNVMPFIHSPRKTPCLSYGDRSGVPCWRGEWWH